MRGSAIPQTNNLDHVRAVVAAIHSGTTGLTELARRTALSQRHVSYALAAARALGWLRDFEVTDRGRAVLATAARSPEERVLIVASLRTSFVLKGFAAGLLDPEAEPEVLAEKIATQTGLSPATAARRAATLMSWRRRILTSQREAQEPSTPGAGRRGKISRKASTSKKRVKPRPTKSPAKKRSAKKLSTKTVPRSPPLPVDGDPSRSSAPLLLTSVSLARFKAAWKPDPIALRPLTVVIGRNGAGKSTLLEALQWVDKTMRDDARRACERYYGVRDLINLRTQHKVPHFELTLEWCEANAPQTDHLYYHLKVRESEDRATPEIALEELWEATSASARKRHWIEAQDNIRTIRPRPGAAGITFSEPDRLALGRGLKLTQSESSGPSALERLQDFWSRAVFLRLSPNRLAQSSPARRKSFEPMLDEEGQNLPALLNELTAPQRKRLVETVQLVLQDIKDVEVSQPTSGRDEQVFYSLKEQMPYRGRAGESLFPIPSWMLSEGTRRITALFALLVHDPAPSLLCVEEIENGLDPWTLITVLKHLQSAAERGTQVIVTTHSPWLLDNVDLDSILHVHRSKGETKYERFADRKSVQDYQGRVPAGAIYINEKPVSEDSG